MSSHTTFRFSDFDGSPQKRTPRGEWLSDAGSLYPTMDVANTADFLSDNLRSKVATMTGYKEKEAQVPQLMRMFRLNGSRGLTIAYDEFVNTLAKLNVSISADGVRTTIWGKRCSAVGAPWPC